MRIKLTSAFVDDQAKTLRFYTEVPAEQQPRRENVAAGNFQQNLNDTCDNLIQLTLLKRW